MSTNLSATTPAAPGGSVNIIWQSDGHGNISGYVPSGGGSGTVTTFSAGTLSPLFTTSVSNPTTTPSLSFTLNTQTAHTFFAGPTSGIPAAPTFRTLVVADFNSGTGASSSTFWRGDGTWAGTGTVTSVALTTPAQFTVSGSPVTTTGTLAISWATQSANLILAGPTTGSAAAPTFRSLVVADFNNGTGASSSTFWRGDGTWATVSGGSGTVTSVAMTGDGVIYNATVSGSPVTTTGTLAPALLAQVKNTFLAGPTSGANANPTFRIIAAADFNNGTGASSTTFLRGDMTWATPSAGSGLASRTTVSTTYTSLAANATDSSQNPVFFKSFRLVGVSVTSNKKCRIRLYSTAAARTADLNRGYTIPIQLGAQSGCIADFYFDQTIAVTPWNCTPVIEGSNQDGSPATTIYASVTNTDTTTQTIVVTYTILQLEN